MREILRRQLIELGATDDEIERAEAQGWLPLLAFDCALLPGARRYDLGALAAAAGIDIDVAVRLWRAVGFPDVPTDAVAFSDRDVAAARLARAQSGDRDESTDALLRQVRAISGALARVASVEADGFTQLLEALRASGMSDDEIAEALLNDKGFEHVAALVDYVHRLQLRAAVWRRTALANDPEIAVAVGFADLAGYTQLSARLDPLALSDLVGRWEAVAYDTIATNGARVVKTIGDEVMFVGLTHETVSAALALRDAAASAALPQLRIGLAAGSVISRDGDYFGPVVNLASRLTELASPGELLVPASMREQLPEADAAGVRFVEQGVLDVRSIGPVEVWALERSG
jgi:adenylate cyclase